MLAEVIFPFQEKEKRIYWLHAGITFVVIIKRRGPIGCAKVPSSPGGGEDLWQCVASPLIVKRKKDPPSAKCEGLKQRRSTAIWFRTTPKLGRVGRKSLGIPVVNRGLQQAGKFHNLFWH